MLASANDGPPVVLKAGFGSNHVLAELDVDTRRAAYGFYWYQEMTADERRLSREDFQHEIGILMTASGSSNVVPIIDQGSGEHFDWYTMPYCDRGNFRPWLIGSAQGTPEYTINGALALLTDVAEGLSGLHGRGIVHRDVYQENILIHGGTGMITDLGAARYATTPHGPAHRGPEVHWPPEYADSYATATPAADVFSLAVLIYRTVCGDIPRLHGLYRLDAVAPSLREILDASLAHDPAVRPTMDELCSALRSCLRSS
jgi:serine/threonine-protein kinase